MNKTCPYQQRDLFWYIQVSYICITNLYILYCLISSIIYYDFPDNEISEGVRNMLIAIIFMSTLMKYCILIYWRSFLVNLIEVVQNDYEEAKRFDEDDKNIILEYVRRGKNICKIWLVIATGASFLFPLKSIFLMAYYYYNGDFRLVLSYDMHYPDPINAHKYEPKVYVALLCLLLPLNCLAASIYIVFDPLIPIFMLHMCGQLELLSRRIVRVFSLNNDAEMKKDLRYINMKLQSIYR